MSAGESKVNTISNCRQTIGDLQAQIDRMESEYEDRISALEARAEKKDEVIRDMVAQVNELQRDDRSETVLTSIEQYAAMEPSTREEALTASKHRAVVIFQHFRTWGQKVPVGWTLVNRRDNVLSLLGQCDGVGDVTRHQQVHRAFDDVETLSEGLIDSCSHGSQGRMLQVTAEDAHILPAGER